MNTTWSWVGGRWLEPRVSSDSDSEYACVETGIWPANDRGLQYGDGLFETMRLSSQGDIPLWDYHETRLNRGLMALRFPSNSLNQVLTSKSRLPDLTGYSGVKLLVSRASAPGKVLSRGYAFDADAQINCQWQLFQAPAWRWASQPDGLQVGISRIQLSSQPLLAGIKHLNRLEQVLARSEFRDHWHEALMQNAAGEFVEGCMSNLFVLTQDSLITPTLDQCGVEGVMRAWLLDRLQARSTSGLPMPAIEIRPINHSDLTTATAILMTNSLMGIVPVSRLELPDQQISLDPEADCLVTFKLIQRELEALF